MPYLLLLILLAILGGPWLVALALSLTGIWFLILWTAIGIALLAAFFAVAGIAGWTFLRTPKFNYFGQPLSEEFKRTHAVERGIWKDELSYLVEIDGKTNYFKTLEEARNARDYGIEGYASPVPVSDRPKR